MWRLVCDLFLHTKIFHTYFFLFIFSSSSIIKFVSKFSILDHLRPFDWREVAEKWALFQFFLVQKIWKWKHNNNFCFIFFFNRNRKICGEIFYWLNFNLKRKLKIKNLNQNGLRKWILYPSSIYIDLHNFTTNNFVIHLNGKYSRSFFVL